MDLECNAVVGQVVGEMKAVSGVSILERISPRRPTCRPLHRRSGVGRFYNLCREIAEMALRAVPPWHESRKTTFADCETGAFARAHHWRHSALRIYQGAANFSILYTIYVRVHDVHVSCQPPVSLFPLCFASSPSPFFSLAFYRGFHVKHLSVIIRLDERPIDNRNTILPRCVLDIDAGFDWFFPVWKYSFPQTSESVFCRGDISFLIILLLFISCIFNFTWFLLFCLVGSYTRLFVCVLLIR